MLEQQRIEYLQAMGIQLWMPRQTVENAAESSWLAQDLNSDAQTSSLAEPIKAGHAADLLADINLTAEINSPVKAQVVTEPVASEVGQAVDTPAVVPADVSEVTDAVLDLTVPEFELHFSLWPCGILWVSGQAFDQNDQRFQASVSYYLLASSAPQGNYSAFKWPYIQSSSEDQTTPVALRALTAQWEFLTTQGARAWVAVDEVSFNWLTKVSSKPIFSSVQVAELYSPMAKKQLWRALHSLKQQSS
jgi:hypothetical protein